VGGIERDAATNLADPKRARTRRSLAGIVTEFVSGDHRTR